MSPTTARRWARARRIVQILFLLAFLCLFRATEADGGGHIGRAVNLLFRADPYLALTAGLAARSFSALFWPALVLLGAGLLFGRFFCGWICPMGTLLDGAGRLLGRSEPSFRPPAWLRRGGLVLLILTVTAGGFGLFLGGFVDPFSILVRAMAVAVDPAFDLAVRAPFDWTYAMALDHDVEGITKVTEPVYSVLKSHVLPHRSRRFLWPWASLGLLLFLVALERVARRFWCRHLCPLGALFGLCSRVAPVHRTDDETCVSCGACAPVCPTGALDEDGRRRAADCILCMACLPSCPVGVRPFGRKKADAGTRTGEGMGRRAFLGSLVAGTALAPLRKVGALEKGGGAPLLRPPGALEEGEFLARCLRCGECMKVCLGNALHPTLLEAGWEGMFSPRLVPRIGYCEYDCTLCGQVCPSGAIVELGLEEKRRRAVGTARVDRNLCLPWAKGVPCLVCEEHCPVNDKAIQMRKARVLTAEGREVEVLQPVVVDSRCIGCGVCENKCPLPGRSAIRVSAEGEARDPESEMLPWRM